MNTTNDTNSNGRPADLLTRTIRTADEARAFLADYGSDVTIEGDEAVLDASCGRCAGTGVVDCYRHVQGGICFECGGAFTKGRTRRLPVTRYAQKLKASLKAAAKRDAARRAKIAKRDAEKAAKLAAFMEAHAGLAEALAGDTPLLREMKTRLDYWGSLSEAQVALVFKVAAEAAAPKAAVAVGRVTIAGTVLSAKWREAFGGGDSLKITVECADGSRVWGTCPAALVPEYDSVANITGKAVEFTATVTASGDDPSFGFFKRPTVKK